MSNIAIRVEGLSKKYSIGKKKDGSFRGSLSNIFSKKNSSEEFWALKDVSFDIHQGDVIGIIGKNGAGKSTLLKILSQITRPTEGSIEINGRVASLLEVGTGFHPELTGRENVYLNGTILGMTRKEVKAKFDEIVEFSGVEKFIDTPVKHYSSGMYVRLAFAVAAHLEPEILIIDEVLAVGDAEFQKKCLGKMEDVAGEGRTVLFVSHDIGAIKSLCNRGILLKSGQIFHQGNMASTLESYMESGINSSRYVPAKIRTENDVCYTSVRLIDETGMDCSEFSVEEKVLVSFEFSIQKPDHPYLVFVSIKNNLGQTIFSAEKWIDSTELILEIDSHFLTRGKYYLYSFIHNPRIIDIERAEDICQFEIYDSTSKFAVYGEYNYGNVFGNYQWTKSV